MAVRLCIELQPAATRQHLRSSSTTGRGVELAVSRRWIPRVEVQGKQYCMRCGISFHTSLEPFCIYCLAALSMRILLSVHCFYNKTQAATFGHLDAVAWLLERGEGDGGLVDSHKTNGWTPLMCAAKGGSKRHEVVLQLLLEKGAAVDGQNREGATALYVASREGHERTVSILLGDQWRAQVNLSTVNGRTPLHCSIMNRHLLVVQLLLREGSVMYIYIFFIFTCFSPSVVIFY